MSAASSATSTIRRQRTGSSWTFLKLRKGDVPSYIRAGARSQETTAPIAFGVYPPRPAFGLQHVPSYPQVNRRKINQLARILEALHPPDAQTQPPATCRFVYCPATSARISPGRHTSFRDILRASHVFMGATLSRRS